MRKATLLPRPGFLVPLVLSLLGAAACTTDDPRFANRDQRYIYGTGGRAGALTRDFGGGSNAGQRAAADSVSYWDGDGVAGSPSIEIKLSEQRAYFYKGDVLVGVSEVSTGREGYDTPPGSFKIQQKNKDHRSSVYGDYVDPTTQEVVKKDVDNRKDPKPPGATYLGAPMPFFMRVNGGVGMHAGYLPGVPASHGCIRMPEAMAENFFNNVATGTPVTIVR